MPVDAEPRFLIGLLGPPPGRDVAHSGGHELGDPGDDSRDEGSGGQVTGQGRLCRGSQRIANAYAIGRALRSR